MPQRHQTLRVEVASLKAEAAEATARVQALVAPPGPIAALEARPTAELLLERLESCSPCVLLRFVPEVTHCCGTSMLLS